MFKNQSSFISPNQASSSNTAPKPIEEMPIHTMAQDLQDPTGSLAKLNVPKESAVDKFSRQNLNDKQKTSPFLAPTPPTQLPTNLNTPPNSNPFETHSSSSYVPTEGPKKNNSLPFIIAFFIILIAGAGIYYFISSRQTDLESLEDLANQAPAYEEEEEEIPRTIPEPVIKESLSASKPNYFALDTEIITPALFKENLNQKSQAVLESAIMTPIEFVLIDKQNNPITFANFAKMTGLSLSDSVLSNLGENFSLFLVNDDSVIGVGLSIESMNSINLQMELKKEELSLATQLDPILLSSYEPVTTPFEDYTYKNIAIRYKNLISSKKLAVDYAVTDTELIFATTKATMEALIDTIIATQSPETL